MKSLKRNLWTYSIPMILITIGAIVIFHLGTHGRLKNKFLREHVFEITRKINSSFADFKYKLRKNRKPQNKVVIVAIDSETIESVGRWPWSRDYIAFLTEQIMSYDPKVVGYDIVFAEEDIRVPEAIKEYLISSGQRNLIAENETDLVLENTIERFESKIVFGWTTEYLCRPGLDKECGEYVGENPELFPLDLEKFSILNLETKESFIEKETPLVTILRPISNIPLFRDKLKFNGILNITPDKDGIVRNADLLYLANKKMYPTLPLQMALVGKNSNLNIELTDKNAIKSLIFSKSNEVIPVDELGRLKINFLGPKYTFPYISAIDLLTGLEEVVPIGSNLPVKTSDILKDAYVLIGVSAIGAFDSRNFPVDENVPGVEGQATILENLLSGTAFYHSPLNFTLVFNIILVLVGGVLITLIVDKFEPKVGVIIFFLIASTIGGIDLFILFHNNIAWESSFVFFGFYLIYFATGIIKYINEEKDKKFFRTAFSNYISPELVDMMYEKGELPDLGGGTRYLTAFFSDIQSFSTFSEQLSAAKLVELLNEYLSAMTDILIANSGTLDKYEGDAIVAFFGAPLEIEKNCEKACLTAIQMQDALIELREKWELDGDKWPSYVSTMVMRIGINSGPILSGNMGSKQRMNYTMMGDEVNLASRLESSAKQYGICIHLSENSYFEVEEKFLCRPIDHIRVVGRSMPVKTYELLAIKNNLSQELLKLYEHFSRGIEFYEDQEWDKAIEEFNISLTFERHRYGGDTIMLNPSKIYIQRCKQFKVEPPPEDWDGVFNLEEK